MTYSMKTAGYGTLTIPDWDTVEEIATIAALHSKQVVRFTDSAGATYTVTPSRARGMPSVTITRHEPTA